MSQHPASSSDFISVPVPWMSVSRPANKACWWCRTEFEIPRTGDRCVRCKWTICSTCGSCSCPYELVRIKGVLHVESGSVAMCSMQRLRVNRYNREEPDSENNVWEWRMQCVRDWLLRIRKGEGITPPWWDFSKEKLLMERRVDTKPRDEFDSDLDDVPFD